MTVFLHQSERGQAVFRAYENRHNAERFEPAIGHVFEIFTKIGKRHSSDPLGEHILSKGSFAIDRFAQHGDHVLIHFLVKDFGQLAPCSANHFKGKSDMRALVAEYPVRSSGEPVQQSFGT